ncbi:MAG TPA: pseudouridine synthase, partial [Cytophagales bacterium]|nr:pseudouridine synthase [Cytophagales bacterium]
MENRNSRKGSSRRSGPTNSSGKSGSYKKSTSGSRGASKGKKPSSGGYKSYGSDSGGNRFDKKRDGKPDFKRGGESGQKRTFGTGARPQRPFGKSFGEGKREGSSERAGFKPERREFKPDRREFKTGEDQKEGVKKSYDKPFNSFGGKTRESRKDDTPRTTFRKDESGKPAFKRDDTDKPSFKRKEEFGSRSFGGESSGGTDEVQRRPKKTFDDKKTEIKSKFIAKSRAHGDARSAGKASFDKKGSFDKPAHPKQSAPKTKRSAEERANGIRLNRYIANSGVCSRRDADLLISSGEITVNGNIVTEMGYIVQDNDVVKYSGRTLKREKLVYVLLNKPKDFITTTNDPDDRRTVMDLVAGAAQERLFPVGRLDRNTTGLLLLTNDGELAEKLSHPSNKIKKIYQVTLDRPLEDQDFEKIQKGVHLEDGIAEVDDIAVITKDRLNLGLEIHIGRNRIVRRIFEALGYNVDKLDRVLYA